MKKGYKLKRYVNTKPILGNGVEVADYDTVKKEQEQAKEYASKLRIASYQKDHTITSDELFNRTT